jgi:hypothetical protein
MFGGVGIIWVAACGSPPDSTTAQMPRTIQGMPDPCEWLNGAQAQELLGLPEAPPQTPMGGAEGAGRACVYTSADQSAWINAGYQGLNPQVFSAQGKSEAELVDLAASLYAHGLVHLESGEAGGYPKLAFQDADRTVVVVFTDIGKRRDLPEEFSERLLISSYYNVVLHLFAPTLPAAQRLAALNGLVERPVRQLVQRALSEKEGEDVSNL